MNSRIAGLVAAMLLGAAGLASAHPAPFSYVDVRINGIDAKLIHVSVVAHVFDLGHDLDVSPPEQLLDSRVSTGKAAAIEALIRQRIHILVDGRESSAVGAGPIETLTDRQSLRTTFEYKADSAPGLLTVRTVMFPYDSTHQTFLNVYDSGTLATQAILDASGIELDYFASTLHGAATAGLRFFGRGAASVLAAADCWLFLFGLLLLGGSTRRLVLVVTAFTVADAVGVVLAYRHILMPPERTFEPALALSLVYLGIDNLLVSGGRDVRGAIAVWFGLVHGFMVVSAMRAVVLSPMAAASSFVSFHTGLELAQILVVLALGSVFAVLRSRSEGMRRYLPVAGSMVLIAAGALWFVMRVFLQASPA